MTESTSPRTLSDDALDTAQGGLRFTRSVDTSTNISKAEHGQPMVIVGNWLSPLEDDETAL